MPHDDAGTVAAALVMLRLAAQLLMPIDAPAAIRPRRPHRRRSPAPIACGTGRPIIPSVRPASAPPLLATAAFNARPRQTAKVVLEAVWWSPTAWQESALHAGQAAPDATAPGEVDRPIAQQS